MGGEQQIGNNMNGSSNISVKKAPKKKNTTNELQTL